MTSHFVPSPSAERALASDHPPRRLRRDPGNKIVAGVAAGLADHLRLPPVVVRISFILLFAANGLGALLYVVFWAVLPSAPANEAGVASARRRRRPDRLQTLGLAALAGGVVVALVQLGGFGLDGALVALIAVVVLGAGIIWHQAEPQRRQRGDRRPAAGLAGVGTSAPDPVVAAVGGAATAAGLAPPPRPLPGAGLSAPSLPLPGAGLSAPSLPLPGAGLSAPLGPLPSPATVEVGEPVADRRWLLVRLGGGGLLVIVGVVGILALFAPGQRDLSATLFGLLFALLALAGVVVALAPVLWRMIAQLGEERVARIREQERAEVAAIVHDQVLHTLALIQRSAADPTRVLRLARGQERTLRNWLYRPTGGPSERFAAALEQVAAEVEDTYGIGVETVMVGDAPNDEHAEALVAATREALVNAARHAKVSTVSLYAEAEETQLSVYVRDRGVGFDWSTVDDDRHGLRGSVIGRMKRHGGRAQIRSAPGEGTEIELSMPRARRAAPAGLAGKD